MAFRETDGRDAKATTGRGAAARWLHALLFEDWSLKLLALAITLGLWYAVTGQRTPATLRLRGVHLEFIRPTDMEISNEPPDEVEVTLQGSRGKLDEINARNLVLRADISQLKPGDRVARLSPRQNVSMELPDGVEIVRVEPGSVAVRLERRVERELEVEARFEGNLPEGFVRGEVIINPARVRVRGPESHVDALDKAHTESISLEGQRESLTLPQTAIDIHDQKVAALDAVVSVRVEIREEVLTRRFTNVRVRAAVGAGVQVQPSNAVIEVRGARSAVERLRAEELEIVVEETADGTTVPRLSLPPALNGRVELVSTSPPRFSIVR
jgi:YbbR domain-containing protein